jgi:TPR repeat protein
MYANGDGISANDVHAYAWYSIAAAQGADIKTIQEFSGHESLEMVMRYAHAQDRAVNSALDRMEQRTVVEHPASQKRHNS